MRRECKYITILYKLIYMEMVFIMHRRHCANSKGSEMTSCQAAQTDVNQSYVILLEMS
jgi:hypothetical protein